MKLSELRFYRHPEDEEEYEPENEETLDKVTFEYDCVHTNGIITLEARSELISDMSRFSRSRKYNSDYDDIKQSLNLLGVEFISFEYDHFKIKSLDELKAHFKEQNLEEIFYTPDLFYSVTTELVKIHNVTSSSYDDAVLT